jgi:8-oxo-dGTP pyrophosphatase MutT (NUDIX family)
MYCPLCGEKSFSEHNEKAKRCEECGFIYYFNPSAAVAAFVREASGRLVVVRRRSEPAAGTLDLPGGFVDSFETSEEALAREVYEETSLSVREARYLFSIPNLYPYSGFEVHTLDIFFECRIPTVIETSGIHASDDVSETLLLPLSAVHPADFGLQSVREAVKRYLHLS